MAKSYAAAASCKVTGVHYLNLRTGICPLCGEKIVKTAGAAPELLGEEENASSEKRRRSR